MPGGGSSSIQRPRGRFPRLGVGPIIGGVYPVEGQKTVRAFQSQRFYGRFSITGRTLDSSGAALGNCVVHLFQVGSDIETDQTTSDGSGNFSFSLGNNAGYWYVTGTKTGPALAGISIDTLVAV